MTPHGNRSKLKSNKRKSVGDVNRKNKPFFGRFAGDLQVLPLQQRTQPFAVQMNASRQRSLARAVRQGRQTDQGGVAWFAPGPARAATGRFFHGHRSAGSLGPACRETARDACIEDTLIGPR